MKKTGLGMEAGYTFEDHHDEGNWKSQTFTLAQLRLPLVGGTTIFERHERYGATDNLLVFESRSGLLGIPGLVEESSFGWNLDRTFLWRTTWGAGLELYTPVGLILSSKAALLDYPFGLEQLYRFSAEQSLPISSAPLTAQYSAYVGVHDDGNGSASHLIECVVKPHNFLSFSAGAAFGGEAFETARSGDVRRYSSLQHYRAGISMSPLPLVAVTLTYETQFRHSQLFAGIIGVSAGLQL